MSEQREKRIHSLSEQGKERLVREQEAMTNSCICKPVSDKVRSTFTRQCVEYGSLLFEFHVHVNGDKSRLI